MVDSSRPADSAGTGDSDASGESGFDGESGAGGGSGAEGALTGKRDARKDRGKKRSFWKELPILIGIALVLTFLINTFIARVFMIPSGSMEQTLHGCPTCTGDRVLVDKVTYAFSDPEPGDVAVFKGPPAWTENELSDQGSDNAIVDFFQQIGSAVGLAPPDEKDFVKRIVAVGGQTVECCDAQNRVLVDGKPLDEPYIYWEPGSGQKQDEFGPVRVPEGHAWMMGDNRNNSQDSRYQGGGGPRGAVPVDNIIGKAQFIILPPSRWQGVSDHDPQAVAMAAGSYQAPAWQQAIPAGVGVVAAWPVLRIGRTARARLVPVRRRGGS